MQDPAEQRAPSALQVVPEEHPQAENTFGYRLPVRRATRCARSDGVPKDKNRSGRLGAAAPDVSDVLAVTFDWSFITDNAAELAEALGRTLEISAIAVIGAFFIGLALGAARAPRPGREPARCRLRRGDPQHAVPRADLLLFYGLPQLGIVLEPFTVAWLSVMIWGGAFNTENFRAGFEAVPFRYREAGLALGFSRIGTFVNFTLPIGGRIALPSSINTYIWVLKNTSLMYVIGYQELTTTATQISALTLQTIETSPCSRSSTSCSSGDCRR